MSERIHFDLDVEWLDRNTAVGQIICWWQFEDYSDYTSEILWSGTPYISENKYFTVDAYNKAINSAGNHIAKTMKRLFSEDFDD